jgi:hypothetical protein
VEKRPELKKQLPFRAWYYFRTGYSQYFAFLLALGNMYTLTYYLAIEPSPSLQSIFPNFYTYAVVFTVIGFPLLALVGYSHMKRSRAYSSEQDITVESNPYSYRLNPGIQIECIAPLYLELLRLGRKSLSDERITEEELRRIEVLQSKLTIIAKGESLPRKETQVVQSDNSYSVASTARVRDAKKEPD